MTNSGQPTAMAATIKLPDTVAGASGIFDDLNALKLSQEEVGLLGSTEVRELIPVRKPKKQEFFRVRQGDEFCFTTVIYEDVETRENYFVTPAMLPVFRMIADVSVVTLVQFVTKQNVLGIFPLKLATDVTAKGGWQTTAMAAAQLAKSKWVRMQADMALSGYRIFTAEGDLGEPEWPEQSFNEILNIAFRDRVIASQDHPLVNKIRGRV